MSFKMKAKTIKNNQPDGGKEVGPEVGQRRQMTTNEFFCQCSELCFFFALVFGAWTKMINEVSQNGDGGVRDFCLNNPAKQKKNIRK